VADASVVFTTDLDETGLRSGLTKLKSSIGTFAKAAGIAIGVVATGLGALAKTALTYNSRMEQYYTSFTTLLGSEEKAAVKMAELKDYAAKTPFEMTDLANATKTILGFGVAEDKASVAMKQLGDISQGNSERFSALALVYGQMASTGKLMGQDLLQMINAGFNPLTIIAQKTGATMADLKHVMAGEKTSDTFKALMQSAQAEVQKLGDDASQSAKMLAEIGKSGQVSSSLVDEAMQIATSEGGLFYQAMEKQSKTAAGLISTLKDNVQILLGDVFTGASEAMKQQAIPAALGYVDQLSEAFRSGGTPALMSALGDVMGDVAGKASAFAPSLVKTSVGLIKSLLNGFKNNATVIAKGLAETFKEAVLGLLEIAPDLVDVGLSLLLELADSLGDELPEILSSLVDAAFNIIVKLVTNAPKLLAAGAKLAQGLVLGMMSALVTLMADFWNLLLGDADEKMNAAMAAVDANIRPEISEADQQAITDAINAGIEAADKVFDIQASVDTDIDDFTTELDAVFADDKFTKKELKNLQNTLNGQVDDAIAAATAHVEEKREAYKQTLLSLVDDNGQPVYTEAAAETLAAVMSEKTAELTAELDQARSDLNTLLNTIYASKTDPTQEQLDNINALLEQIGVLEVKLGTLQDQAVQVALAKTGRVKRGEGTTEDFSVAIGFSGELYRQQTAEIKADADARLAALQAIVDADGATQDTIDAAYAQMDTVYGETALAHQAAVQSYNDEMLALYNGMAEQYPDAARTISNIADLSGALNEVSSLTTTLGTMNEFDPTQLSSFLDSFQALYTDFYGMDIPVGDMERLFDPFTFATTASELLSTFNDDIAGLIESNAAGLDNNPMILYLQTMLENGSFDNLDITAVDGALQDALELIDFVTRGEEAGTQLVEGVNGGIGEASENLSEDDIIALREAMLKAMRDVFGIHSPAESMFPIGEQLVEGILFSMQEQMGKVEDMGSFIVDAIVAGVRRNMALRAAILAILTSAAAAARGPAYSNGFGVGAAFGSGVLAGIQSMAAAVAAAAASLVSSTASGARRAAGIHSPSTLFRDTVGKLMASGVGVGFVNMMQSSVIPSVRKAITTAAQAGQDALNGTLLGKVQAISGFHIPSFAGYNNAILKGSLVGGTSSVVNNNSNKTIQFTQNVTFESTMQAPDEIAKALRRQAGYGLAGAK